MHWLSGLQWGHTEYYHPFLLSHVPTGAKRALDVGCGTGLFARELSLRVAHVDAIDVSDGALALARERSSGRPNITYRTADLLHDGLDEDAYDYVSCLMSLHHMQFVEAVTRLRALLKPGGVLAILGLGRLTVRDIPVGALTVPVDMAMGVRYRVAKALGLPNLAGAGPEAPVADPTMTWSEIKAGFRDLLPTGTFKRHLFYRCSLIYRRD